jgi:hypothetical protein
VQIRRVQRPASDGRTPLLPILGSREGDVITDSARREGDDDVLRNTRCSWQRELGWEDSVTSDRENDSYGTVQLACDGCDSLATGVIFLTDQTQRSSTVELVLLWILVLSGIKMTILGAVGRYPLPRWLNVLVPNPPK